MTDSLVWIVLTPDNCKDPADWDCEVLNTCPQWDWTELGQVCFKGHINGGDAESVYRADT